MNPVRVAVLEVFVSDFTAIRVEGEPLTRLRTAMTGASRMFVRYAVKGASSGDAHSYGCAPRTRALAQRTDDGELLWWPALTVRAR